jgi:ABC-2 type transport system permease protein
MTRARHVATIARWEFNRFVKWRQQFIGVAVMLVLGAVGAGVSKLVTGARTKPVDVAVVGAETLGHPLPVVDGVTWQTDRYTSAGEARSRFVADSLDGALLLDGPERAEILVRRKSAWTTRVAPALTQAAQVAAYARLDITPDQRRALSTPLAVVVTTLADGGVGSSSSRLYANLLLGVGFLILFSGFASLFAGITGEKQQRITEQMLSMVTPQSWIDGKLLGLAGAATAGTVILALTGVLAIMLLPRLTGRPALPIPPAPTEIGLLAIIALVTILGTAMWFAFMAAIAATIDDPNSSPRSAMMMIPILPTVLAFTLVARADSTVAQVLAIFPLTSMSVLPVRLLATSVPWWEPVVAVLLLALTAWAFRRAAGKIFAAGVLLYAKEPTLAETLRWAREA